MGLMGWGGLEGSEYLCTYGVCLKMAHNPQNAMWGLTPTLAGRKTDTRQKNKNRQSLGNQDLEFHCPPAALRATGAVAR
jgi:hypothetical protein